MLLNSLKPWIIALWQTNTARWWVGQSGIAPSWHLGPLYWSQFHNWFKLPGNCAVGEQGAVVHPSAAEWVFAVVMQLLLSFTLFCFLWQYFVQHKHSLLLRAVLLLLLIVPSHLVTAASSTVCWAHLWPDSVHYCWWKLPMESVSRTLSLFQQKWAQESL